MAPDRGLSSSFKRHVPADNNRSYGWMKPQDWYRAKIEAEAAFWLAMQGPRQPVQLMLPFWAPELVRVKAIKPGLVSQDFMAVQPLQSPHEGLIFKLHPHWGGGGDLNIIKLKERPPGDKPFNMNMRYE